MVDPSRIRLRIGQIEVDETSTRDLIHIDFYVGRKVRWYLSYDPPLRSYTSQINKIPTNMPVAPAFARYLWSIVPADIKARCIAASLGAAHPATMRKEET